MTVRGLGILVALIVERWLGSIELHAPTSSTQKLKLIGRGGQFTYIATGRKTGSCVGGEEDFSVLSVSFCLL